jgi:hypothetical protein
VNESLNLAQLLEIVETRYGSKAACRRVDSDHCLVVIFEGVAEESIVVTALRVNAERVRKYGFTRV